MPDAYILAGPNGAGKTYVSEAFIDHVRSDVFINADNIAKGLRYLSPLSASMLACKVMLHDIEVAADKGIDFAFETTLSGKIYTKRIRSLQSKGYKVHLVFYWVNDVEICIERVRQRVAEGGHSIPEEIIRRRYIAGLRNFFNIYMWNVEHWEIYDNSDFDNKKLIAKYDEKEIEQQRGISRITRLRPSFRVENRTLFLKMLTQSGK